MNNINAKQLFSILIAVRMFSIICSADPSNAAQMTGAALSLLFQILAAIPMLLLYKGGFSLKKDILMGKFGKILYIIFFIFWGAISFSNMWEVTKSVYFPIKSSFIGSLILAAVCVYTASLGIKALSRASGFMLGLIGFSLLVMLLGAYPKADLSNFSPDADFAGVIKSAAKDFCRSGELVMMFILLEFLPSGRRKSVTAFFTGKIILTEVVAVIEITVLGKIMGISDFPFFSAGAFSQPFSIQRADSLYMILFTMLCIMTITIQIALSALMIKELLPEFKYRTLFSTVLMLAASSIINFTGIDLTAASGGLVIILAVIMPLITLTRRNINENKKTDLHSAASGNARRV